MDIEAVALRAEILGHARKSLLVERGDISLISLFELERLFDDN
jgi:hypothetical protein